MHNALEEKIDYSFKDQKLLRHAVTHSTFAYESRSPESADYDRLEFLGDSLLGLVVAEYLYKANPSMAEGELTRKRSLLVNDVFLAEKARVMGIGAYLRLGKGEEKTGGREKSTNLAGSLEAIIAAIYLDGGFEEAKRFIVATVVEK